MIKKKAQAHLLMVGALLLVAVIVVFAVIRIGGGAKKDIDTQDELANKTNVMLVSPNIVKIEPISCQTGGEATVNFIWNPVANIGDYELIVETYNKQKLDVNVESTGTAQLDVLDTEENVVFYIPSNTCNETFYFYIEVTKDQQKELSLKQKVNFNVNHIIPGGEITPPEPPVLSGANFITSFRINSIDGIINNDQNTIDLTVPMFTDVTNLVPTISLSQYASVNPTSGTARDFTNPVNYIVTAQNSDQRIYTVTVDVSTECNPVPVNGELYFIDHLLYVNEHLDSSYRLMTNLDFSNQEHYCIEKNYQKIANDGWDPIGSEEKPFVGKFNGNNKTISNLNILTKGSINVGFFGIINNAEIEDLILENVNIVANNTVNVGGLVGVAKESKIKKVSVSGIVQGTEAVGGLIGRTEMNNKINLNKTNSQITSLGKKTNFGGLIGIIADKRNQVSENYTLGTIDASYGFNAGGLIGMIDESAIENRIENNYSLINVSCQKVCGGLIGTVTGSENDTIIGFNYSAGLVSGIGSGGLIGIYNSNPENIARSYYNKDTSKQTDEGKGIGLDDRNMRTQRSFEEWSFGDIWVITENVSYPYLKANPQQPLPGQ
ncbi:MAG: hypothetical protein PHP56_12730 [Smithellaceae bacterium]|nr:hypothetical protein [Smithellaceae bacterium]